jgi:hypothetical protein
MCCTLKLYLFLQLDDGLFVKPKRVAVMRLPVTSISFLHINTTAQ